MENEMLQKNDTPVSGDTLRIAGIVRESIVDGNGIRFTVFWSGLSRIIAPAAIIHRPIRLPAEIWSKIGRIAQEIGKKSVAAGCDLFRRRAFLSGRRFCGTCKAGACDAGKYGCDLLFRMDL